MKHDSQKIVSEDVVPEDDNTCETVCYHPECACRERVIAGCSLPLAPVLIESRMPKTVSRLFNGDTDEK